MSEPTIEQVADNDFWKPYDEIPAEASQSAVAWFAAKDTLRAVLRDLDEAWTRAESQPSPISNIGCYVADKFREKIRRAVGDE